MARATVIVTPGAENDLDEIWYYVAVDNLAAADRLIDKLRLRLEQLMSFPESGRSRPDIGPDARSLTIGNYLVLYRVTNNDVEVARVVHGARDL